MKWNEVIQLHFLRMKKTFYYYPFPESEEKVVQKWVDIYVDRLWMLTQTKVFHSGSCEEKNKPDKAEEVTTNLSH